MKPIGIFEFPVQTAGKKRPDFPDPETPMTTITAGAKTPFVGRDSMDIGSSW
jgi:hypothetical protein